MSSDFSPQPVKITNAWSNALDNLLYGGSVLFAGALCYAGYQYFTDKTKDVVHQEIILYDPLTNTLDTIRTDKKIEFTNNQFEIQTDEHKSVSYPIYRLHHINKTKETVPR